MVAKRDFGKHYNYYNNYVNGIDLIFYNLDKYLLDWYNISRQFYWRYYVGSSVFTEAITVTNSLMTWNLEIGKV